MPCLATPSLSRLASLIDDLLGHVVIHALIVHSTCVRLGHDEVGLVSIARSWPLVQDGVVDSLLLLLQLLHHVVIHQILLLVKDLQTVVERHVTLQVVVRPEELGIILLTVKLKGGNVNALKSFLKGGEGFGERQEHEDALQSLQQVLRVLVLPRQFNAQVDEAGRLDQLDEGAKCDQLGGVHLDLGEPGDQSVGKLVVAGQEAESQRTDRVRRPCLEQSEEQFFLGLGILWLHLAHQDATQGLVLRRGCNNQGQSLNKFLLENEIPMIFELGSKLHEDLLGRDGVAQFLNHLLDLVVEFGLTTDNVEPINKLGHYFAGVVSILCRHHADEQHDALDEARILKVQVDNEALEDILVLLDQILTELLE